MLLCELVHSQLTRTQPHTRVDCDPLVLHELGVLYFRTERYEEAEACFGRVMAICKDNGSDMVGYVCVLYVFGEEHTFVWLFCAYVYRDGTPCAGMHCPTQKYLYLVMCACVCDILVLLCPCPCMRFSPENCKFRQL